MADANPFEIDGFVNETMPEQVQLMRQEIPAWFALAEDTNRTMMRIQRAAKDAVRTNSMDPQAIAVRLLIRACYSLQGVIVMTERGMVAEARMLVRSIAEDAIYLAALVSNPDDFIAKLKEDSDAARARQGKFLLAEKLVQEGQREKLMEAVEGIGKVKNFNVRDLAGKGPLTGMYLTYLRLSDDAGHMSAKSIDRHIHRNDDGTWLYKVGPGTAEDNAATLYHAVMAAIAVGVGITDLIEATRAGSNFRELADRVAAMPAVPTV
ncbi:MAG: DUF5677 domain-containing protein [Acidobacteriota bacterium]